MGGRITIVAKTFPSVSETFVIDHVLGMARRGWQVQVVCRALGDPALVASVQAAGATIEVLDYSLTPVEKAAQRARAVRLAGRWALGRVPAVVQATYGAGRLAALVERFGPDLVHAHFGQMALLAALADPPVPVVADFHGSDVTVFPVDLGWSIYDPIRAAQGVAHSEFIASTVRERLGLGVTVVPLGVDLDLFAAPGREPRVASTDAAPGTAAALHLVMVGRLVATKGHAVTLDAVAEAQRRDPDRRWRITLVGSGPAEADLRRRADELGVRLDLTGSLVPAEIADLLGGADVFAFPSLQPEGFGRVLIEAMAAGLPVIVADGGAVREVVGDAGTVVPPGDPAAMASALVALDLSPGGRAAAAERSRRRAERYSLTAMIDGYEAVAERAAAAGPTRRRR